MLQAWGIKSPSEFGEMDELDRVFNEYSWIFGRMDESERELFVKKINGKQ